MAAPLAQPSPLRSRASRLDGPDFAHASDGAILERLARMRAACQALALELAGTRRELRAVQAELRRVKQRHGDH
jgi:predicted RNA polymerase sigma factor